MSKKRNTHWEIVRGQRWYAIVNDVIGGYAVCNTTTRMSDQDYRDGQYGIADFVSQEAAEHIAYLHNTWLDEQ